MRGRNQHGLAPPARESQRLGEEKPIHLGTLPQRKQEKHDREPCQDACDYESRSRDLQAMTETHFHPPGQAEQKEKERGINQNYADPFLVVGFHQ